MSFCPLRSSSAKVTGERIRDKIAASKQKGMWMGGWVPIGYDRKDRTLTINETEALTVRTIFDLFLKLKNVQRVQTELMSLNLRPNPMRPRAAGRSAVCRLRAVTSTKSCRTLFIWGRSSTGVCAILASIRP